MPGLVPGESQSGEGSMSSKLHREDVDGRDKRGDDELRSSLDLIVRQREAAERHRDRDGLLGQALERDLQVLPAA